MRGSWLALTLAGCTAAGTDPDGSEPVPDVVQAPTVVLQGVDAVEVGQEAAFRAEVTGDVAAVRWVFGDGETLVGGAGGEVTHTWTGPGHYVVEVQVQAQDGRTASDRLDVAVIWPVLDPAPRASSSVVASASDVFVALPDLDAVARVDVATWAVVEHLRPCPSPRRLALGESLLAVTCEAPQPGVVLYDVEGGEVSERARKNLSGTGRTPFGVVVGGDRVWVTARGRADDAGVLLTLDSDLTPLAEPSFGADLRGLAWMDREVLVSRHRSPDDAGRWFRLELGNETLHEHVLAVDTRPDSDISSRGVPSYLEALAIRPDGRQAALGGLKANVLGGLWRDGSPLTDENTTRAELRFVALHPGEGEVGGELGHARLDDRDLVSAVAYAPRGDWVYAATLGMQTIEVFDAYTLGGAGAFVEVGAGVDGLAVDPTGRWLVAHARYDRVLVVYDLTQGPSQTPRRLDLRVDGLEPWAADVLEGARIFHTSSDPRMSRDGYTSCASCHLDGEDDGRVWDFTDRGEGLRDTLSLRGMDERAGGPIHWSGNFDEVQDFEHDIRGPQAGTGFLPEPDWQGAYGTTLGAAKAGRSAALDALAAYVESLGVLNVPWSVDVTEGRALFEDPTVGCADCHPGGGTISGWEDGQPRLFDVGTLTAASGSRLGGDLPGLDVPSLRGVWASPPYLHDGSAATLRDVVTTRNPGDLHGVTGHLTEGQIDALVDYLRSL